MDDELVALRARLYWLLIDRGTASDQAAEIVRCFELGYGSVVHRR